jgi:(R,R)-butanediol dehydrogenase/meso-butanediol dehydrogenase/diacetyl reductase
LYFYIYKTKKSIYNRKVSVMEKMKACVVHEPGDVRYEDAAMPVIGPEEALIKVTYTGICGGDVKVYTGHMGNTYPRVPGHEFEGILVDYNTTCKMRAEKGDRVTSQIYYSCNTCDLCATGRDNICFDLKVLGNHIDGSFAQYVKVPARKVFKVKEDLKEGWGALTEPLAVGVHAVNTAGMKYGDTVLIIGGGIIGITVAIAAKLHGASQIIISELNENRIALAQSMGFTTIDADKEDVLERVLELTGGKGVDSVYEVTATDMGFKLMTEAVKRGGIIVEIGLSLQMIPIRARAFTTKEIQVRGIRIHSQLAFEEALNIIQSGQADEYLEKFITHIFDLKDMKKAYDFQLNSLNHFKILLKVD